LYEGAGEITGVASPDGLNCTVTGRGGTQTHAWYIAAVDSSGNQTFPRSNANGSNCYHAPTSYDKDDYETLKWVASPNASSYRLYLGSPSASGSQISLVAEGITATSYKFAGRFPSNFPLRANDSPYNKTLIQIFRGKESDFQYGTPLKGFSDRGKTQKWSIDSSTGTATFTNLVTSTMQLQSGSMPKCDATHRGQLYYVAGGKGKEDVFQICLKAADESYSWRVVD
jgi:hypothetical protein